MATESDLKNFTALLDSAGHTYTRMGAGIEIAGKGYVYLSRLTTLPENVTFSNGGSVYLSSLEGEYHTYRGETVRLRHIDGLTMLILSERTTAEYTIFHAAYFGGGDMDKLKRCYVAQLGDSYAHGRTVQLAMRDVRFKAMERDFDEEEIVAEIKARGTVMIEDFRLITGACEEGVRHGMGEAGLDPEANELPLAIVLGAAFGPYGARFKALFAAVEA